MKTPRMEVYLNDQAQVSIANVKGGDRAPLVIDLNNAEFAAGSESEAAQRLGAVIIETLKLWHPKEMAEIFQSAVPVEGNRALQPLVKGT